MKRLFRRFRSRFPAEFKMGALKFKGTATNLSERGLFIKTSRPLKMDFIVDVTIFLPDKRFCTLRGIVRSVRRRIFLRWLNGMGIEILKMDPGYIDLISRLNPGKP